MAISSADIASDAIHESANIKPTQRRAPSRLTHLLKEKKLSDDRTSVYRLVKGKNWSESW